MAMREVPLFVVERPAKNPVRGAPRYKIALVKEAGGVYVTSKPIVSAHQTFEVAQRLFEDIDREAFFVLCLDNKLRIIGVNLVSVGTLSASLVHPREVFKPAILLNAARIICIHNHPSGDPGPSGEDDKLTYRLVQAGVLLGIPMADHVICGETAFFSYSEHGLIERYMQEVR